MTRIATADGWNTALLDLMRAQGRQLDAQNQVSTEKKATDLKGFGREAETLAAFKSAQLRLKGFVETSQSVASRLTTQDLSLNQVGDATQAARQAIADALASGDGSGLMLSLQQQFLQVVDGLNSKHQGRYLFAGARADAPPVAATTLADLTAGPPISTLFKNDQLKTVSRLDETATVETGMLASDVGTSIFTAFQSIQAFSEGASGPFSGTLTQVQKDFLTAQLSQFDNAHDDVTDYTAQNGAMQKRVDSHVVAQQAQVDSMEGLIGQRTDVDMAEALSNLEQAKVAVQASAQVLASLKDLSLLNYLR